MPTETFLIAGKGSYTATNINRRICDYYYYYYYFYYYDYYFLIMVGITRSKVFFCFFPTMYGEGF